MTIANKAELVAAQLMNANLNKKEWGTLVYNVGVYGTDGAAIQKAIDDAYINGGGTVMAPPRDYLTSSTIIVKWGVELVLSKGATIKPTANIDVIQLKPNSKLIGGAIDCKGVAGFTEAAIFLDGADKIGDLASFEQTLISKVQLSNNEKYTGTGIKFYCATGGDYIMFVQCIDVYIRSFDKAILMQSDPHDGSGGGSWITGNNFENIILVGNRHGFYLNGDSPNYSVGGNLFSNIQIQPFYYYSDRAIYVAGSDNFFQGLIWDWSTDRQTIAIEVASSTSGNNVFQTNINKTNSNLILDKGFYTQIIGSFENHFKVSPVSIIQGNVFNGDQDDFLAYATQRYAVTSTPNPTSGSITNMFLPDGQYGAVWNNTVNSFVIEIDMTSSPIVVLQNVGISFLFSSIAKSVKIEAFTAGVYQTLFETANNFRNTVNFMATKNSVSKLKFTVSAPIGNDINIGRIFAQDSGQFGNTWVNRMGGNIYGDMSFIFGTTGPIVTAPNGSKYRIKVDNAGVLSATLVP